MERYLFRSLLKTTSALQAQGQRLGAVYPVLQATFDKLEDKLESRWLRTQLRQNHKAIKANPPQELRAMFETACPKVEQQLRLDDAFRALKIMREQARFAEQVPSTPCSLSVEDGLQVQLQAWFLPSKSQECASGQHCYAYRLDIKNNGPKALQIIKKTWQLAGNNGLQQHRSSWGLNGQAPSLSMGNSFMVQSCLTLKASSHGVWGGSLQVLDVETGKIHDVCIPAVALFPEATSPAHAESYDAELQPTRLNDELQADAVGGKHPERSSTFASGVATYH